ncbi:MAG: hypothetical protein OXI26_06890 [bacterium]|nr:hypothetical protein [bacterium]
MGTLVAGTGTSNVAAGAVDTGDRRLPARPVIPGQARPPVVGAPPPGSAVRLGTPVVGVRVGTPVVGVRVGTPVVGVRVGTPVVGVRVGTPVAVGGSSGEIDPAPAPGVPTLGRLQYRAPASVGAGQGGAE